MEETAATIRSVLAKSGYLADPHTATAMKVAREHRGDAPMVILSTAHIRPSSPRPSKRHAVSHLPCRHGSEI
jgi:threonine synthase